MKTVRLVIVGFGIIGRGFAKTLSEKRKFLRQREGIDLKTVGICEIDGCLMNEDGINLSQALSKPLKKLPGWLQKPTNEVLDENIADVVVELTPGNIKTGEPGLKHIRNSLAAGMHVVTSNKAPLALKFSELTKLAKTNDLQLKYEATVGGAIPVINTCQNHLRGNEILDVYGILNGTTNFILSKMFEEGVEFDLALKEAKELGIAEPDPSYDIQGIDTAAKVVILANALMGKNVSFKQMTVSGIDEITPEAVDLGKKHNYAVKLIGDVSKLEVSPRLVPITHPLNVSGSLNAVMVKTDIAGEVTLIGRGAGPKETSSAILNDVLSVA